MATVDNSTVAPTKVATQSNDDGPKETQHELTAAEAALSRIASTSTAELAPPSAAETGVSNVDHSHSSSSFLPPPLLRRHSLPAHLLVNNILSFWNGGDGHSDNLDTAGGPSQINNHHHHHQQQQQAADHSYSLEQSADNSRSRDHLEPGARSSSAGRDTSGVSGSSSNVNRHRYGHRHTKSAQLNQPVIVKTYNPPAESNEMGSGSIPKDWQKNRVELPSVDSFSFSSILKSVEPQVNEAKEGVSDFFQDYRDKIKTETDVVDGIQNQIDGRWKELNKLSTDVEKAKKERSKKINSAASNLDYAIIDDLAQAADRSYSTLESIISTLLAIDELLPPTARLTSPSTSTHYPRISSLVTSKSIQLSQHQSAPRRPSTTLAPPTTPTTQTPSSPRFIIRYSEHDQDSAIELDSPPRASHPRRFSTAPPPSKNIGPRRTSLPPQVHLSTMVPVPTSPCAPSPKSPFANYTNRPNTTGHGGPPASPTVGFLERANSFGSSQARRLSWSLGGLFGRVQVQGQTQVGREGGPWGLEVPREETARGRLRALIGEGEEEEERRAGKRRSMIY
ncbi:hypothetical protein BJ508DRAFT_320965 [Ascobolus immersus RN42]|uniref:BLOC-1-related complex subunit 5 n=1 Tax=Ascobolus immersus RN42 TaxID=1160509 RepID=A0A3N4IZJ4_ASCIM|nr:hypothetical protein BJ508DRAFT_320965 [Ascobolus immersus RN42]